MNRCSTSRVRLHFCSMEVCMKKIKMSITSTYIPCTTEKRLSLDRARQKAFFWSIDIGLLQRSQLVLYERSFERPASLITQLCCLSQFNSHSIVRSISWTTSPPCLRSHEFPSASHKVSYNKPKVLEPTSLSKPSSGFYSNQVVQL